MHELVMETQTADLKLVTRDPEVLGSNLRTNSVFETDAGDSRTFY